MLTSWWHSKSVTRLRTSVSPAPPSKPKCSHRMLPEIRRSFRNTKRLRFHTEAMASLPKRGSERKYIDVLPLDRSYRGVQTSRGLNCDKDLWLLGRRRSPRPNRNGLAQCDNRVQPGGRVRPRAAPITSLSFR